MEYSDIAFIYASVEEYVYGIIAMVTLSGQEVYFRC
jgi:hypothetical protein